MEAPLSFGLWTLAGVALLGTAVRSHRCWGEPGARSFTGLAVTLGVAGLALAAGLIDPRAHLVGVPLLYSAVPVVWAVFAFEFTGRYDVGSPRRRLLLAAPAVFEFVVFAGFTLAASDLTGTPIPSVDVGTMYVVVNATVGATRAVLLVLYTGLFVGLFSLLGLLLVATAVLMGQLVRYDHLGPNVAYLLSVSAVGPWLVMMTANTVATSANLDPGSIRLSVALTFAVAAAGTATALERYDLFAAAPAAGTVGPERLLEDLSEPIVVVDHDERVVRLNPAARRVFGTDHQRVGTPVADLLGHDVASLRAAGSLIIDDVGGHHHYEATVSEMTDRNDRIRGHAVVLRDVTGREVRQQRLEVLNRVLRHNLRNDLTAIRGRAELLGTDEADETAVRDVVLDRADELISLSDRAREVEQMLSVPVVPGQSCDLGAVVAAVLDEVADEYDADVSVSIPDGVTVGVDARILQPVVHNLVANAIRHHDRADPTIEVSATVGQGSLPTTLSVADDGPGLPEEERMAVERGHEKPLEHGSGLGLWAIKWGVTRIGGRVSIRDNEPRGTVVELGLPAPDDPDAGSERRDAETVTGPSAVAGDPRSSSRDPESTGDGSETGR